MQLLEPKGTTRKAKVEASRCCLPPPLMPVAASVGGLYLLYKTDSNHSALHLRSHTGSETLQDRMTAQAGSGLAASFPPTELTKLNFQV